MARRSRARDSVSRLSAVRAGAAPVPGSKLRPHQVHPPRRRDRVAMAPPSDSAVRGPRSRSVFAAEERSPDAARAAERRFMSVPGVRPLSTGMRVTLVISGGLTFIAGLQLFVGSSRTDRYFAWTIKTPLTAAFFGAAYWAALVLVLMAARERDWANARVSVIAALNVVPLIMIVTFVHFSRFHVHSDSALTLLGTWAFIATYVWLSVVLVFFFV